MRQRDDTHIPSFVALPGGCWLWTRSVDDCGYATVRVGGKTRKAHRLFYEEFNGPVPNGLEIDHLCRVRACVNPAHMQAVTHEVNTKRLVKVARAFCKNGHALTPDNISRRPGYWINDTAGWRCRLCLRAAQARYHERQAS